ncbi:MAG: hypothetical protein AB4426_13560 [Xenococcaceae cyanobacterium]
MRETTPDAMPPCFEKWCKRFDDCFKTEVEPTTIYAEDLSSPIKSKKQSKRINRRLNNWMKEELQTSLEEIGQLTG